MRTSSNNATYFGNINTMDLLESIQTADWQSAVSHLPDADKHIVLGRVEESRQLHERGKDFLSGGYTPKYAEGILRHSFELTKEGMRDAIPKTIDPDKGNFGWFRSGGSKQNGYTSFTDHVHDYIRRNGGAPDFISKMTRSTRK